MAFAQPFQDAFDAGRTLAPAAVGTQVLIMSAFSLVTLVLFNLLRPRNKVQDSDIYLSTSDTL